MHTIHEKKNRNIVSGKMPKTGHGLMFLSNGAGRHKHKTDVRNGVRSQVIKRIIKEY